MKPTVIADTYLVYSQEIAKNKTTYTNVDEIENYLIQQINNHSIASYIATFDHYVHTKNIGGVVQENIKAAKNVMCCFGMGIPSPAFVAVKPMSIAVVETVDSFVLSFIQAPAPSAQEAMKTWVEAIENVG